MSVPAATTTELPAAERSEQAGWRDWAHRHRWLLLGLGALVLLVAYHVWWLVRMRLHYPVDIDEAGYLTIGLNDLAGLRDNGLSGLWDAVQTQTPNAPLVPLLSVPAQAVHEGILSGFAVELFALVVVACATFALARRFVTRPWAVLAVFAVVAMPGVINYTREFSFALPCAAALTCAVCAMAWSSHMTRLPMALLWGLAAGLAVLARTMAIGFMPGLVAGAFVYAVTAPATQRARAVLHVAAGAVVGVAVAALWYWRNLEFVVDYLRGYGYGSKATQYGVQHSVLSWDWWVEELRLATSQSLFVPLALALALVLVAAVPWAVRALVVGDRRAVLARVLDSPAVPVAIVPLAGYLALSSTANGGSAFALPVLPTVVVLIVAAASTIPLRWLRTAAATLLVAVSALQLVSFAQLNLGVDQLRKDDYPIVGLAPVTDPRSPVVGAVGQQQNELTFGARDEGWLKTVTDVVALARSKTAAEGYLPIMMFATRDVITNTNTAALMARLNWNAVIPTGQLVTDDGDDTAVYAKALMDPNRGQPNILITSSSELNDIPPTVTQSKVAAAARRVGFTPFAVVRQPNGEKLTLWWLARGPTIPSPPSRPAVPAG